MCTMDAPVKEWLPHVLRFVDVATLGRVARVCGAWRDAVDADAVADVVWAGGVAPLQQAGFLDVALSISAFKRRNPQLAELLPPSEDAGVAGPPPAARGSTSSGAGAAVGAAASAGAGAGAAAGGGGSGRDDGGSGSGSGAAPGGPAAAASAAAPAPSPPDALAAKAAAEEKAKLEAAEAVAAAASADKLARESRASQHGRNPNIKALHGSRYQQGKLLPALVALERCFIRIQPHSLDRMPLATGDDKPQAPAVRAMETALLACPLDKAVVLAELLDACPSAHMAVAACLCLMRRMCIPKPHRQAEMALSWWQSALLEPASDDTTLDKVPRQLLTHAAESLLADHMPQLQRCVAPPPTHRQHRSHAPSPAPSRTYSLSAT